MSRGAGCQRGRRFAMHGIRAPPSPALLLIDPACRLQYFSRVFTATRFAFLEAVKEAISSIAVCEAPCLLAWACPRARLSHPVLRPSLPSNARPPSHITADLCFMLMIMAGWAVAFHVLFRKDQQFDVSACTGIALSVGSAAAAVPPQATHSIRPPAPFPATHPLSAGVQDDHQRCGPGLRLLAEKGGPAAGACTDRRPRCCADLHPLCPPPSPPQPSSPCTPISRAWWTWA